MLRRAPDCGPELAEERLEDFDRDAKLLGPLVGNADRGISGVGQRLDGRQRANGALDAEEQRPGMLEQRADSTWASSGSAGAGCLLNRARYLVVDSGRRR